jgi:hypothetical protein
MNKKEFAQIYLILSKTFTWFKAGDKATMSIWYKFFEHDDYHTTELAIMKYISESNKTPTVADIRAKIAEIKQPDISITGSDAWGQVLHAIRYRGIYQEQEALAEMDPIVARIVKRLGWKNLCMSENQMADRAHFIKLWDSETKETKHQAMLPTDIKGKIAELTQNTIKQLENANERN